MLYSLSLGPPKVFVFFWGCRGGHEFFRVSAHAVFKVVSPLPTGSEHGSRTRDPENDGAACTEAQRWRGESDRGEQCGNRKPMQSCCSPLSTPPSLSPHYFISYLSKTFTGA